MDPVIPSDFVLGVTAPPSGLHLGAMMPSIFPAASISSIGSYVSPDLIHSLSLPFPPKRSVPYVPNDSDDDDNSESILEVQTTPSNPLTLEHKASAQKLLTLILNHPTYMASLFDVKSVQNALQNIIDIDLTEPTTDPDVYVRYEYDYSRAGYFAADAVVPLSVYLANLVCETKFWYSDVLGKHSELDFTIDKCTMEYCEIPGDHKREEHYSIGLDEDPHTKYGSHVFTHVLDDLQAYMVSLEPMKPADYRENRCDELEEYAEKLLVKHLKTNDPTIELVKEVPKSRHGSHNSFSNPVDIVKFSLPLSKVLCLLRMNYMLDIRDSWEKKEDERWPAWKNEGRIFPIASMMMTPIREQPQEGRWIDWYDSDFKASVKDHELFVGEILNKMEPLDPIIFFDQHFESLKAVIVVTE